MKLYKVIVTTLFLGAMCANVAFGIENNSILGIEELPNAQSLQAIITPEETQQSNIAKYLKQHTNEQNLEVFLTWRNSINSSLSQNNNYRELLAKELHSDDAVKTVQNQLSKTGLYLLNSEGKYKLAINYDKIYKLYGKHIPEDWALYLKDLAIEQKCSQNILSNNEQNLVMWEDFADTYPNFEEIYVVYEKMQQYEKDYFTSGVFKGKKNNANIYKDEVVVAYDKFSDKHPYSNYAVICTRLSNLKKLKHSFVSPYKNQYAAINEYKSKLATFKANQNFVREHAQFVYDLDNNCWHKYSDEYIRGNYIFVLPENDTVFKIFDKNYIETSVVTTPEAYNLKDLCMKNNRIFLYDNADLKIQEMTFNKDANHVEFKDIDKITLADIYKGATILYTSSSAKTENNNVQLIVKGKKYPKKFFLYNDTQNSYAKYNFENNPNVKFINNFEFVVNSKTTLHLKPILEETNEEVSPDTTLEDENIEKDKSEILPIYEFIFK